ncbi:disease resistance protein RPS5-like [Magnolia sinica]|uniref:disease resistance protein RPS5-like n=1 Tax=Magnolia sinica TaxID=86752 RepID=UPI00265AA809|nr:disease resistance protein RPS5-like [Magnolia sinica]XP_058070666.1 disease resistance protein RPS5-like [Magnolia sinica]
MVNYFTAVLDVVKLLWDPLARQISYVKNVEKNVENLRKERDVLTHEESDVTKEVERAKLQRRDPKAKVNSWLKDVNDVKNEVSDIEKEFKENMRCLKECLPNYYNRRKLSKRALETTSKVKELKGKVISEDAIAVDQLPPTAHTLPTPSLRAKTSAEIISEQILGWIKDAKIGMVGVYGMGGVGKTTIMMNINNRLKDAKLFQSIIWVTVSEDLNLKRLQTDIAKKVQLNLQEGDDEVNRAAKLHDALLTRQKFLLILDDLWKSFPLEKVGIPEPNEENGCKIALTSRSLDVCRGMKTDKNVKVKELSKEEAWDLFKDHLGSNVVLASNVQTIAKLVTEECGGLPLALITVGEALRDIDDVHEWSHALNQLRSSECEIEGIQDEVFRRLQFSYNRLSNEKSRACFLYCSLYPEDYKIPVEEVIKYWICEQLIDERGDIQSQIDNGHSIVNGLTRACMLESFIDEVGIKYIKMHDLLRDMAIDITKHNPRFIVKAGTGMEELLKDEEWVGDVERVSLMSNRIHNLVATPNCPKLTTLFLQGNPLEGHITPSFFRNQHMCGLKVLDLSDSRIECLPDSLSSLVNLRALVLTKCCYLSAIPSLAKLNELRLLDLSFTNIDQLPQGMERLANLRFLDLSYMYKLERIDAGVISKLPHLEHFTAWQNKLILSIILDDQMEILTRLVHLRLSFSNLVTFSHYVQFGQSHKLKKFSFSIGNIVCKESYIKLDEINYLYEFERLVYLGDLQVGTRESLHLLPANTVDLIMIECSNFTRLSLLSLQNVEGLKFCRITWCFSMKSVLSVKDNVSFLTALEHLFLESLPNLQTVCRGVATPGTFQSLNSIIIYDCYKLKNLFSVGWLKNLQNLEKISIKNCNEMTDLVTEEEDEEISAAYNITLPKLKNLYLLRVNKLKKICSKVLVCSSMVLIQIEGCSKLKKIPFSVGTSSMAFQGEIRGTRKWWNTLEWDDPATKPLLHPLFKEVEGDDNDDDDN